MSFRLRQFDDLSHIVYRMIDLLFKTLADPNRRRILQLLKEKDMTVSELQPHFDITQASLSHHLSVLKSANLVTDHRR